MLVTSHEARNVGSGCSADETSCSSYVSVTRDIFVQIKKSNRVALFAPYCGLCAGRFSRDFQSLGFFCFVEK